MQTIAGSHQKLERGKAKFFQELLRKRMPLLDIRLLVSRTEREQIFVVLSNSVFSILLWEPQVTNIHGDQKEGRQQYLPLKLRKYTYLRESIGGRRECRRAGEGVVDRESFQGDTFIYQLTIILQTMFLSVYICCFLFIIITIIYKYDSIFFLFLKN